MICFPLIILIVWQDEDDTYKIIDEINRHTAKYQTFDLSNRVQNTKILGLAQNNTKQDLRYDKKAQTLLSQIQVMISSRVSPMECSVYPSR